MDHRLRDKKLMHSTERHERAASSVFLVVPDEHHGWKVKLQGTDVGPAAYATREEAIRRAEEMAQTSPHGVVEVHDINGMVEARYEIAQAMRRTG